MRWLWVGMIAVLLGGCPKRERQPGTGSDDPTASARPIDGGFAVTGRGAGARPGVLAGAAIDAAVDAALGILALPECAEVLRMMEDCLPQLQPPSADGMQQGIKAIREGWTSVPVMPPEALVQMRESCKLVKESMRESMLAMGCVVP